MCASVQQAIVECLVVKTIKAAQHHGVKSVILAGGVSANKELRLQLGEAVEKKLAGVEFLRPEVIYCTDNAAMIAAAGYFQYIYSLQRKKFATAWKFVSPDPCLDID